MPLPFAPEGDSPDPRPRTRHSGFPRGLRGGPGQSRARGTRLPSRPQRRGAAAGLGRPCPLAPGPRPSAEARSSRLGSLTYHVNELCDGQAKVDKDHIRDVGHRPGPLVVAREQLLQQPLLGVGPGLHVAAHWGQAGRQLRRRARWLQAVLGRPAAAPLGTVLTSGPLHVLPSSQFSSPPIKCHFLRDPQTPQALLALHLATEGTAVPTRLVWLSPCLRLYLQRPAG